MVDDNAVPPRPHHGSRFRAIASSRGLIIVTATFTLLAGAALGAAWVSLLRSYWRRRLGYHPDMGWLANERVNLSVAAVVIGVVLIITLLKIARNVKCITWRLLATYWTATIALWAVLAMTVFTTHYQGPYESGLVL